MLTAIIFLFVGTLEPRKNLGGLIKAYSQLSAEIRDRAHLIIVGGKGWGNVNADTLVRTHGVESTVHIAGKVDDNRLASLYEHAMFLAMPSLYEGFGLPLLEAMAYGTPVLTSNISSMPEVADNAGLLVDPSCAMDIRAGLERMICDAELRADLAKRARLRSDQFSWDQAVNDMSCLFMKAHCQKLRDESNQSNS